MGGVRTDEDVRGVEGIGTIVVVGAGTMGQGIAQVLAANRYGVLLVDRDEAALERARSEVHDGLRRWLSKGLLQSTDVDAALEFVGPAVG